MNVKVKEDRFLMLGPAGSLQLPNFLLPPLMSNHGNYIVSMANVCRWLASQAEDLGVEIFPGMACSELVFGDSGEVKGVVAGEFGKDKNGNKGDGYEPGMELYGKYVILAEGARGSLTKELIARFSLDDGKQPQKFGLGMKEIWEISPEKHRLGQVTHTMGWPLGRKAGGGSFIYHIENNQIYIGFVVHLNYENPYRSPYMEFQEFKTHPKIRELLEGGKRIAYGARAISEGGWQSIPKLTFPGGAIVGCGAGLVNVPRIKGNHNAMLSGILVAESIAAEISKKGDLKSYERKLRSGIIGKDLKRVRNVKPLWTKFGLVGALIFGALDMWIANIFGVNVFGSLAHGKNDAESTGLAKDYKEISYKKPDGKVSFERLTNLSYSATNHEENQPCHLVLSDKTIPISVNLKKFAEPAQRYCPAGVYEVVTDPGNDIRFQINAQNCLHCKTCDIKDPSQNINWRTPQGGEGPNYPNM